MNDSEAPRYFMFSTRTWREYKDILTEFLRISQIMKVKNSTTMLRVSLSLRPQFSIICKDSEELLTSSTMGWDWILRVKAESLKELWWSLATWNSQEAGNGFSSSSWRSSGPKSFWKRFHASSGETNLIPVVAGSLRSQSPKSWYSCSEDMCRNTSTLHLDSESSWKFQIAWRIKNEPTRMKVHKPTVSRVGSVTWRWVDHPLMLSLIKYPSLFKNDSLWDSK